MYSVQTVLMLAFKVSKTYPESETYLKYCFNTLSIPIETRQQTRNWIAKLLGLYSRKVLARS